MSALLATGQIRCYDAQGREIPCGQSGQDGASQLGVAWPEPRFLVQDECVQDQLTGLTWARDASLSEFPLNWEEALAFVATLRAERKFGFDDWRLPNRRELRSLMSHQTRQPALPEDHPFQRVFSGWYWTSTSAAIAPSHAWYIHMEGARMFYGGKDQSYMMWPVRGMSRGTLLATGLKRCYDNQGNEIRCAGSYQDGELQTGRAWPTPRFTLEANGVRDHLTGLLWLRDADLGGLSTWEEALQRVAKLNETRSAHPTWRLPNINELESLVDCARHTPALPQEHLFQNVRSAYWSSTSSAFEPDWAWALYLDKGATGVGQKTGLHFSVWPCSG